MSELKYEFAEILKRAGIKPQAISTQSRSPEAQGQIDILSAAVKKFIAEAEQAHQSTRNSTLRFGHKITAKRLKYPLKEKQLIRY